MPSASAPTVRRARRSPSSPCRRGRWWRSKPLRCAEMLLVAAVAFGALGATEGETPLHETVVESGVRIVVTAPSAAQVDGVVEVAVALPFGWADDRSPAGRGLASLAATFATH